MQWPFFFWKPGAGAVTVSYARDEPAIDASTNPVLRRHTAPEIHGKERQGSKCLPVGPESRAMHEPRMGPARSMEQAKVEATVPPCNDMRREALTAFRPGAAALGEATDRKPGTEGPQS